MDYKEAKKYFKGIFLCGAEKLPKEKKEELWNYIRYLMDKDRSGFKKEEIEHQKRTKE